MTHKKHTRSDILPESDHAKGSVGFMRMLSAHGSSPKVMKEQV